MQFISLIKHISPEQTFKFKFKATSRMLRILINSTTKNNWWKSLALFRQVVWEWCPNIRWYKQAEMNTSMWWLTIEKLNMKTVFRQWINSAFARPAAHWVSDITRLGSDKTAGYSQAQGPAPVPLTLASRYGLSEYEAYTCTDSTACTCTEPAACPFTEPI